MSRTLTARQAPAREVVPGGLAALPGLNMRVCVSPVPFDDAGATGFGKVFEAPTRVEDLHLQVTDGRRGTAELVVAQPVFPGDVLGESVGARYLLRWVTERGLHEVTARYVRRERIGPVLIGWRLAVSGPVTRIQRRAHARVTLAVPVEVEWAGAVDGDDLEPALVAVHGQTVDLSEGGVLTALPTGPGTVLPADGGAVTVRFEVAGERFAPSGRVVRHQPLPWRPGGGRVPTCAVAVAFDAPDAHGDRLRPLLFAHQLHARRVGVA